MKQLITILTASSIIMFAACKSEDKSKAATELENLKKQKSALQDKIAKLEAEVGSKDSVKITKVNTLSMTPTMFRNYVIVQGRLDASNSVLATSQAPGIVSAIYVHNGQMVRKGQLLATLRSETIFDDDVDKAVAQLDQQIEFAKTLYDKQKRLWEQEIGTEVQLLSAKNNYEALLKNKQAVLVGKKRVQVSKGLYSIVAPISGMVDNLDLRLGQMVSPGLMGIRIVNNSALKVKASIPENYVSKVSAGDETMIIIPDLHDTFTARVSYVSSTIDPSSRTFAAEISAPFGARFKPNMIAVVKVIAYKNDHAFVLPAGVIQNTLDGKIVFVNENGIAKKRNISTGDSYEGSVEIMSGLNLGDKVITEGFEDLMDGDKIQEQSIN